VIPVYKQEMTEEEKYSLRRCAEIFAHRDISFMCPEGLDVAAYRRIVPGASTVRFLAEYFGSKKDYSRLMLHRGLYAGFDAYDYILIYQLDAFVFEDQLDDWCAREYDYYGAPWFRYSGARAQGDFAGDWIGVGNGGFSLRRVSNCLKVLESNALEPVAPFLAEWQSEPNPKRKLIRTPRLAGKLAGIGRGWQDFLKRRVAAGADEDLVWGNHVPRFFPWFRVAPIETAKRFAVETGLEHTQSLFEAEMPFGCHGAWFLNMFVRFFRQGEMPKDSYEEMVYRLGVAAGLRQTDGAA